MAKLLLLTFLILLSFYISFYNLGKPPLDNWDEAWYGDSLKHMIKTKELILLHWNNNVFLEKPPLYFWLSFLPAALFGVSEFSIRIISAISGFLTIVLLVVYLYKKYGFVPTIIGFSSIALNNIYIWRTRSGNLDTLTALFIFVSYFLIISKYRYRLYSLGIIFGLIYLTKLSYVIFPLSIFLAHELLFRRKDLNNNKREYFKFILAFVLLPAIWLSLGFLKAGAGFVSYYLYNSDQGASIISFKYLSFDYISYAYYSLQRRFFYVFIIGLLFVFLKIRKPENFLTALFSLSLLVFLSFAQKKNNWYLVSSMPFWSLVIAYGTYRILELFNNAKIVVFSIVILAVYISYKTFTINIMAIINTTSAVGERQSGLYIKNQTRDSDVIVRLDHLYPSMIYYSERKVLVSPSLNTETHSYFVSRGDLIGMIKKKKIKWLAGTSASVDTFIKDNKDLRYKMININNSERVVEIF